LHANLFRGICKVDNLTSKKYAKTCNFLCAGNKDFVKYQAQGGLTPTPCVRPYLSIYIKRSLIGKKVNERTEVFVLLKQKKFEQENESLTNMDAII